MDTTKDEKIEGDTGAAVSGRFSLAGTEARPTILFSYKVETSAKQRPISGYGDARHFFALR
jgi:hypothetical protein